MEAKEIIPAVLFLFCNHTIDEKQMGIAMT
jgi:hypothetical protein